MSTRPIRSSFTLAKLIEVCECFYAQDGFVKWTDVGAALGVSRQAVQLRLRAAVEKGDLPPETVERWQSMSSRAATSRERESERRAAENERRRRTVQTLLSPENHAWLREVTTIRRVTTADYINGLITREREATERSS
jgi:hypothetical protein